MMEMSKKKDKTVLLHTNGTPSPGNIAIFTPHFNLMSVI